MKHLLFLTAFFLSVSAFAGQENLYLGARQAAMGQAGVAVSDLWSVYHNQAGLAWLENPTASISYENRFLITGLGLQGVAAAYPTKSGVFGLSASSFGNSAFREDKYGLAFGKKLGERFSVGVQLDYLRTLISENYGNKSFVTGEIGLMAKLTNELTIGAHIYNPTRSTISTFQNEKTPVIMRLGLSYVFSDKVLVTVESEKDIDFDPVIRGGIEYRPIETLYLRLGAGSQPTQFAFGFGVNIKQFKADLSATNHQVLGYSPQLSLSYEFK